MFVYFCYYISVGILAIIEARISDGRIEFGGMTNKSHICVNGSFILLVLLLGLRHQSMGNDLRYLSSNGYLGFFDRISYIPWQQIWTVSVANYEQGFVVLNKLISSIWNSRQFYLLAIAFLSIWPLYKMIKRDSPIPALSYIIYMGLPVFLMQYTGLRQIMAIAWCVYSVKYIQTHKKLRFIVTVCIACLFHSTAWVFLIAYPLYYLKLSKKARWLSVAALGVIYVLRYQIFYLTAHLIKDDASVYESNSIVLYLVFTFIYIVCFMFCNDDEKTNGYMNLFYIACAVQSLAGVHNLAMRIGYYFMVFLVILLPLIINQQQNANNKKILAFGIALCFLLYGYRSIESSTFAQAAPYYFFWENVI